MPQLEWVDSVPSSSSWVTETDVVSIYPPELRLTGGSGMTGRSRRKLARKQLARQTARRSDAKVERPYSYRQEARSHSG
jgi:hypothetical protein